MFDPDKLGPSGAELYNGVRAEFDLRVDEEQILRDCAQEADIIDLLERRWREEGEPLTALGSSRQPVIHPTLSEIRSRRANLSTMLQKLRLSDTDDAEFSIPVQRKLTRSEAGKKAAAARWSQRG